MSDSSTEKNNNNGGGDGDGLDGGGGGGHHIVEMYNRNGQVASMQSVGFVEGSQQQQQAYGEEDALPLLEERRDDYVDYFPDAEAAEAEAAETEIQRKVDELMQAIEAKYPNHPTEKRNNIIGAYMNFHALSVELDEQDFQYLDDDEVPSLDEQQAGGGDGGEDGGLTSKRDDDLEALPIVTTAANGVDSMRKNSALLRVSRDAVFAPVHYQDLFDDLSFFSKTAGSVRLDDSTFIVNASLDYIYSLVLDTALLEHSHPALYELAFDAFSKRAASWQPCDDANHAHEDDTRRCSRDFVIYTKLTSSFALHCMRFLDESEHFCYSQQSPFAPACRDYVSFFLVLFLCGEHIAGQFDPLATTSSGVDLNSTGAVVGGSNTTDASSTAVNLGGGGGGDDADDTPVLHGSIARRLYYTETNQWIRVPVMFADIWRYAMIMASH